MPRQFYTLEMDTRAGFVPLKRFGSKRKARKAADFFTFKGQRMRVTNRQGEVVYIAPTPWVGFPSKPWLKHRQGKGK